MAQPSIDVSVDAYDTTAPGEPVEAVDVFYDQLSPYGVWVDEPAVGHVFIPEQTSFVPYTTGHWQYTSVGFVWVSSEPFAWATSHYGRWAFSQPYARWVWLPDTQWGPAWVEWRQTGDDFGWAPLAPQAVINVGYAQPIESWHYCGSAHVLDVDVYRRYEPRDRVVVLHREARPIEHYATVSSVKVVVGPPAATLRERHITVRPVKAEAKIVGRMTATEAHAQVARATERKVVVEEQNKKKIEANVKIKAVVEKQPAHKVETKTETKVEPKKEIKTETKVEPKKEYKPEPKVEPKKEVKTETKVEPKPEPKKEYKPEPKVEPKKEVKTETKVEPKVEPKHVEAKPEPKPAPHVEAKPEPKKEIKPDPKPEPKKDPAHTEKKVEPKKANEKSAAN